MEDNIRCDYLIITDGKDMTQKSAHLINDTLRTLTSQPKVLIRNIHDQGKQKDKIKCKKVMFLLLARVSFFQLLLKWLDALPGITNWNTQVLVLIQEQDTEIGDRSDMNRVLSEINQEKGINMKNWISSFNDISSWWSLIIHFLFKVKSFQSESITYKVVFAIDQMKSSKRARILFDILSSFKLKENDTSEYIVNVINGTEEESVTDNNAGININYKSDSCELSIAMLAVLIDLKVIKAKQTKQTTRAIRSKAKPSNRVLTCLFSILYSCIFVLTCLLNLPFVAIHAPFTCCFCCLPPVSFVSECFVALIFNDILSRWKLIIVHNIMVFIMFCILIGVLSLFSSWISIWIGIYAFVWPILLHNLLCKIGLDYGVVSLPLEVGRKVDFGLLRILNRHFETMRKQTRVSKIKPILDVSFKLIHIPFFILYFCLFIMVIIACDESKRAILFFSVFYTNFALALGFGIGGGILLLSKVSLAAIILILISIYIFFFLCVLNTYCWLEHDLAYGILSIECYKENT